MSKESSPIYCSRVTFYSADFVRISLEKNLHDCCKLLRCYLPSVQRFVQWCLRPMMPGPRALESIYNHPSVYLSIFAGVNLSYLVHDVLISGVIHARSCP